jgi:hypothetical protein
MNVTCGTCGARCDVSPHGYRCYKCNPVTTKYPELMAIAEKIAEDTIHAINAAVKDVESVMPYKAQWVLEETIKILEDAV